MQAQQMQAPREKLGEEKVESIEEKAKENSLIEL